MQLAELVALLVVRENRELGEGRAQRQLLALERHAHGQQCVLELVLTFGELGGDEAALARLAQAVEPFPLLAVGRAFLLPQRTQLVAAEEVRVARDDRGLLGHLFLADADRTPLLGPLVQVALELFFEFGRAADRGRRHREDSIQLAVQDVAPASRLSTSAVRA